MNTAHIIAKMPKVQQVQCRTYTVALPKDKEHFLDLWKKNDKIRYITGQEERSETGYEHFQLLIGFNRKCRLTTAKKELGIDYVEVCENIHATAQYVSKSATSTGNFIRHGEIPKHSAVGKSHKEDLLKQALDTNSVAGALSCIEKENPIWYISCGKQLGAYFEEKFSTGNQSKYNLESFQVPPIVFDEKRVVIIFGPTGLGKTQWALAHFKKPVHVRDRNDYLRIGPNTDGLVFDDMTFANWDPLTLLRILDIENDVTQNVKYAHRIIKAGMKRIFLCNSLRLFFNSKTLLETQLAIARRIRIIEVCSSLFTEHEGTYIKEYNDTHIQQAISDVCTNND